MATSIDDGITTVILQEIGGTYGSPQIQSIRNGKDAQLIFMPLPNSDSNKAIGFDLYGVKREITINGIVAGTKSELQGFFTAMEGLIDGEQWNLTAKSLTFKVDFNTELSYSVLMKSFFWTWDKGAPSKLNYTLVLAEIDPTQGA